MDCYLNICIIRYILHSYCILLSTFSYINQRNRLRNQIEKEEAMKAEYLAMQGAAADPFTRRHSRPTLVTKV